MTRPLGTTVGIRLSAVGAGVSGVMRCSKTICPSCGPRIAAERRRDIERAVDTWRASGRTVLFLTLTLRHSLRDSLADLVAARSGAWRAATGGRGWARDRREFGVAHTIRALEEKWSASTGWHAHVHALLFIEHAPGSEGVRDAVAGILPSMFSRWSSFAVAAGLGAPLLAGQDLHEVTGDEAGAVLGEYFAKQAAGSSDTPAADMAWEMSNPAGKSRGDSFTPSELLGLAAGGDDTCARLWSEYERGMKGLRTITWSRGLRDELGLDDELTDEEIAESEVGTEEDTVLSMTARSWMKLARIPGARHELLRLVVEVGPDVALAYATGLGLVAVPGLHQFEKETP